MNNGKICTEIPIQEYQDFFDTHKEICKQINVKPKYEEGGR